MSTSALPELIGSYLDFILSQDRIAEPLEMKTTILSRLLDEMALRSHDTSGVFTNEDDPAPIYAYEDLYKTVGRHFAGYGYYSTVLDISPLAITENHCIGDAIDDMVDIALDLSNVLEITQVHGEAAGHYAFVDSYRIHWGFHLRQLQVYLHCQVGGL